MIIYFLFDIGANVINVSLSSFFQVKIIIRHEDDIRVVLLATTLK
jgi:hypothetical protein